MNNLSKTLATAIVKIIAVINLKLKSSHPLAPIATNSNVSSKTEWQETKKIISKYKSFLCNSPSFADLIITPAPYAKPKIKPINKGKIEFFDNPKNLATGFNKSDNLSRNLMSFSISMNIIKGIIILAMVSIELILPLTASLNIKIKFSLIPSYITKFNIIPDNIAKVNLNKTTPKALIPIFLATAVSINRL